MQSWRVENRIKKAAGLISDLPLFLRLNNLELVTQREKGDERV